MIGAGLSRKIETGLVHSPVPPQQTVCQRGILKERAAAFARKERSEAGFSGKGVDSNKEEQDGTDRSAEAVTLSFFFQQCGESSAFGLQDSVRPDDRGWHHPSTKDLRLCDFRVPLQFFVVNHNNADQTWIDLIHVLLHIDE